MDALELVDRPGYYNTTVCASTMLQEARFPYFNIRTFHVRRGPDIWAACVGDFDTKLNRQYGKNTVKSALTTYIKVEIGDVEKSAAE